MRAHRILIALAGLMGAAGIVLAAASAHLTDAARLGAASSMLLFHAAAVPGTLALAAGGVLHPRLALAAASGFVVAAALFAGDLTLRQCAGHGLFPFAAPTGGSLLIASWLVLALSALRPPKR